MVITGNGKNYPANLRQCSMQSPQHIMQTLNSCHLYILLINIITKMRTTAHPTRFQFFPFLISVVITFIIAAVASIVTVPQVQSWYPTLNKPGFNPPNQLFGPVWSVLYLMIATAAYLVWKKRDNSAFYVTTKWVYGIQLLLNFSWSIVFFGLHQILIALVVIVLLWVSIIANMYYFKRFSTAAFWLLVPYLLWVSFATALNFSIYLLNG